MRKLFLFVALTAVTAFVSAQVKVGNNPTNINSSAALEVESDSKGLLLPRVALTATNNKAPMTISDAATAAGMIVYNTVSKTVVSAEGDFSVSPGFYYWDGAKWIRMAKDDVMTDNHWRTDGNFISNQTSFLGTTNDVDLVFKRSSSQAGILQGDNAAFGVKSLNHAIANGAGNGNSAFGTQALMNNTGSSNSAFGMYALEQNKNGNMNVALGHQALFKSTANNQNIAVGSGALQALVGTTNHQNIAIGTTAMGAAIGGSNNVAVGTTALNNNTTGQFNTAVGQSALATNTTGNNNIAIGKEQNAASATASNQLNIGGAIFGTGMTGNATAPAGNVGIKKTDPAATLHVGGNVKVDNAPTATIAAQPVLRDPTTGELQVNTSNTKLFYTIRYDITTSNGDWVNAWDTKIPDANHIVTITSATFTRTNGSAAPIYNYVPNINQPTVTVPASVPQVVSTNVVNGTWRLNADFNSVSPYYKAATDQYKWIITVLVINKSFVGALTDVSGTAEQTGGTGAAASNPLP